MKMKIKIAELSKLMKSALTSKYYSPEEADMMVEVFLHAELTGKNTQGILKLLGTEPAQDIKPKYPPKITKETNLSALIDGGGAAGPLVGQVATDKVIEIAKKNNFAIVGTNNTYSSVGAIGFYARKIANNNLIGIVAAGSPRGVLHFGGIDPAYGTNPTAYGFPTLEHPIVFDMAASAITWYGLVRAKTLGQKLTENVAIDKDGNPTTDPDKAMNGAILPFDRSYKGSGLAMVVELLTGPLVGASYVHDDGDWGTIFIAINPDLLVGDEEFKKNASELVHKVKSGRSKDGQKIHIPGYDSENKRQTILDSGEIEIEEKLINDLESTL
jgi:LDH2 family malate/lactate/ureidoglycolate dehydrogenase